MLGGWEFYRPPDLRKNQKIIEWMRFAAFLLAVPVLAGSFQPLNIPLRFEPNVGQSPSFALFSAKTKGFSVLAGQSGLRFADTSGATLEMRFYGARIPSSVTGQDLQPSFSNYFIGSDPSAWRRKILNFGSVLYKDLYPGVHLKLHQQNSAQLEYDFLVDPGADPASVQLEFAGALKLEIDKTGDLIVHTRRGLLRHQKPKLYQGSKQIDGRFVKRTANRVGFLAGSYDKSKQLVIDPVVLYSTYIGANLDDQLNAMVVNPDGTVIVAGATKSTNFPRNSGATITTDAGGSFDTILFKLNASGTNVVFSSVIGGNRDDIAQALAVDSIGNIYVAGTTSSTDLPVSANAFQKTNAGGFSASDPIFRGDAFLIKLDPTGTSLMFATYLGGSLGDSVTGLLLDRDQSPILIGNTLSATFPVTANAFQRAIGGNSDGFIAKLNAIGTDLVYSTFLGGSGPDSLAAITTDADGGFYVTGATSSPNFRTTANAPQKTLAGNSDIFATKFSNNWSLEYSTFYGGTGSDAGTSIAVDSKGIVVVAGTTTNGSFPVTSATSLQDFYGGGNTDGVFFSLDAPGTKVRFASFFGGNRQEENLKVRFYPDGSILLAQTTDSTNFPVTADAFRRNSGGRDILLIKVPADLSVLTYATYFGGANNDFLNAIHLDTAGNIYLSGNTDSQFFPVTRSAFQPITQGGTDGFVLKIGNELPNLLNSTIVPIRGTAGGPPALSEITLTSDGSPLEFRLSATSTGNWLSATPISGTTPATIRLVADPGSLISGNYTGRINITTSGALLNTLSLTIPLTVTNPSTSSSPEISASGILNGANYKPGPLAPGEVITIFGTGIGPAALVGAQLTSAGTVSKFIGNTRVLFDGVAAPLLYVSANQTSAIAPYFLSNRATTNVEVEYIGVRSNAVPMATTASSPAIFTLNAAGTDGAAALNEDGSVNSADKPAKKGGIIVLYATGEGQTDPDGADGQLGASPLPKPLLPIKVSIDGKDAEVLYAGAAPGLVAGAMQVNVRVPANSNSGNVPILLTVGEKGSTLGVTIAVQ